MVCKLTFLNPKRLNNHKQPLTQSKIRGTGFSYLCGIPNLGMSVGKR